MGTIYMIRNIKNDKRYVGQSVQPVEKRFRQHIEAAYLLRRAFWIACASPTVSPPPFTSALALPCAVR